MFLGHAAVAFSIKRAAPQTSLGALMFAAYLPDAIWPVLLLTGVEQVHIQPGITTVVPLDFVSYPYSHSLAFDALWALLLAGLYFLLRRDARGAIWLAVAVLSHWLLDVIAHRPDMPLLPSGPLLGLGLWNSLPATLVTEFSLYITGIWLYASATAARDRIGAIGWWLFVSVLAAIYLASVFGPPPPSENAIAISDLAGLLLIFAAWWIDRHRTISVRNR